MTLLLCAFCSRSNKGMNRGRHYRSCSSSSYYSSPRLNSAEAPELAKRKDERAKFTQIVPSIANLIHATVGRFSAKKSLGRATANNSRPHGVTHKTMLPGIQNCTGLSIMGPVKS